MTTSNSVDNETGLVDIDPGTLKHYEGQGYSPEVLPIPAKERPWNTTNFITVWMGPIHNILSYFTVVGFFALGLGALQVVAAIMVAAVIVSVFYVLNGHAAAKYGIPFAMQLRDTFGVKGSVIPALMRGFIAGFVFMGITTVSSAQAFDGVMSTFFPGYMNIGGGGAIFGLPIPTAISYLLMWVITVALFLSGMAFIDKFSKWANPVVYILMIVAVIFGIKNAGGITPVLEFSPVDTPVTALAFISCVSVLVSNWAGPIVNISDLSRNAQNTRHPAIGFPVGVIVSYILFAIVSIALMASLEAVAGSVDPNQPTAFIDAINSIGVPAVSAILILAMIVGNTAFVVFGNMLPSGLQLTAQLPKIFTVKTGAVLTGIVATIILPWKFLENTTALFFFYSFIGSMFGPIAGIMLASYYLLRKRTIDLDHIYVNKGSDGAYRGGVNWWAVGVLATSFIITMSGKFIPVTFLQEVNNMAFFSGLIIGFVGYAIVGRFETKPNPSR